ncbi:TetR/AcrR family transcriptional regulator [Dermatobacter hominis]|uniref:TetR/AcrR family transcriptional regulator n=1 Tax=Dermatobacter hominis TaxID=2884263 RepID=UPI001D11FB99|nr:TetR/AcrR family transcriptional regulator [Dermatobacter hominis]UDY38100.1 TetR/AcrR family transcriptional regulator [Dermatobacter hominis]
MTDVTAHPDVTDAPAEGSEAGRPARPRNPRGQGDRLRDELLEAALRLLADAAHPDDVSIRAIAREAGVSPTAAYRHFDDRDELVMEAVGCCFQDFAELLGERIAEVDDPFQRLQEAGRAYFEFAEEQGGRYRVLFSNPVMFESPVALGGAETKHMAGDQAFDTLVQIVQDCIDAGAPTRTDDARFLSYQVWTWAHGIVDLRITHHGMDFPDSELMLQDLRVALGLVPPTA